MTDHGEQQVDQKFLDKQSRTIGTYGLETMTKLISFKVLIVGCGGVGVETAKNLALAGIHTISLYDSRRPVRSDMGVNFAITEASLNSGKNVAEITAAYIAELNPNTRVRAIEKLTQPLVSQHTALIFTTAAPDLSIETLNQWNIFCRSHTPCISFMLALQLGVAGSVFVDHGSNFVVKDPDGRPMLQKSITEVTTLHDKTKEEYTRIRFETPEGQTPGALRDYTQIKFTEVEGLTKKDGTSINNQVFDGVVCPSDPRNTVRVYPSFRQQGYSAYVTGGFIHELKETIPLCFRTFQDSLTVPGRFVPVSPMMDNSEESQTHLFVHAVLRFADAHKGRLPSLHKAADAHALVAFAKAIIEENKKILYPADTSAASAPCKSEFPFRMPLPPLPAPLLVDVINEESIRTQGMIAAVELQPLSSFFGAVVAQEVVKITGKYTPIHQWFHLAAETVLPAKAAYGTEEFTPTGSRYDSIVSIFGKSFQHKLENLRIFMVGCGALGCENIKNFALCGISCGQQGSLVVTDNDRIEISNLSRQFLFREDNVGQPKSVAAAARMRQMNPKCNVDARQDFVGTVSEHLFPDSFWQGLDVVVNALDNMEARLYVDEQCVRFNKVLVEAGTMGTGGNVDIIVPHKTSSYADGGAADQTGGIPMCTLRNFPYIYDHCIEWARATFDDLFVSPMQSAHQIIEDQHAYVNRITQEVGAAQSDGERRSLIEKHLGPLKNVKGTLSTIAQGCTMDKCAQLAFEVIFKLFRDRIYDLRRSFPKDAKKKNGEPFWSGHRKYPNALEMEVGTVLSNPDGTNFLISCINLYACMFGLHPPKPEARFNDEKHRWMNQYRSVDWLKTQLSKLSVPRYVPGAVEGLDDDAAADASTKDAVSVSQLQMELDGLLKDVAALASRCRMTKAMPLEFEKDDDDNFQIDFIAAASNLRAENYIIPTQDRMMVKLVAGKIIPAIATTTSAVTGLSLLEFFKVLQGKDVSSLRNGMLDVGTNNYVLFERDSPIKYHTKIISTYLPEQDYTYKKKLIRIPEGYTKYDTIKIDVTQKTTVQQFADSLAAYLNSTLPAGADYTYEVDGVGVGKGLIWNGRKTHSNTHVPIMDAIEKQKVAEANGSQGKPFWENRKQFFDLSVTISVDDGEEGIDEEDVETATICLCIK